MIARCALTLSDTVWHRLDAADFVGLGGLGVPVAGWRFRTLEVVSVATNDLIVSFGERLGDASAGTRGAIVIPERYADLDGSTLTLGTLTVTFAATGTSTGTTVSMAGKTRAQVRAEVVALITALATGIADIEAVAAEEPGLIVLQSDAADASAVSWTRGQKAAALRVYAEGLTPATVQTIATGGVMAARTFSDAVHAIAVRTATANSVIVLEADLVPAGWPSR